MASFRAWNSDFAHDGKADQRTGMVPSSPSRRLSRTSMMLRSTPVLVCVYRRRVCKTTNSLTEVVIAPPALYLLLTREHLRKGIEVAAQNVYDKPNGAFTGEISAEQLKDSGITWTILGHSERRTILQEDDAFIASKTKAALDGGLSVILCCGESLEQREAGSTVDVVTKQLKAVAEKVKDGSKIVIS